MNNFYHLCIVVDIVITYVDGNDPEWLKQYGDYSEEPILSKRFRDWGTLKYLLRGIEKNIPFVGKVHLVVSAESQVPSWIDRSKVHVVFHSEIIPPLYLPVFNSSTIEMFLHRIPGLAERFIYFNDDLIPVRPLRESDFFQDGKVVKRLTRHLFALNDFKILTRDSDRLARRAAGKCMLNPLFLRPQHTCTPLLKSRCDEVYEICQDEIFRTASRLRERGNFNQYLFSDYIYYKGDGVNRRLSCRHFSLAIATADQICSFLENPDKDIVCINDVEMSQDRFASLKLRLCTALEGLLGEKSVYEL